MRCDIFSDSDSERVAYFVSHAASWNLQTKLIYWDRGRPARTAPQARSSSPGYRTKFSRFALSAGGTPAVPVNALISLTRSLPLYRSKES